MGGGERMVNYIVWDGSHNGRGRVFATLDDARKWAEHIRRNTGEIIAVTETDRKATHKIKTGA